MKVVTGIFNSSNPKYGTLFKVFLYSLKRHIDVPVVVYHTDLTSDFRDEVDCKVGNIEFIPIQFRFVEGLEGASQKVFLWHQIVEMQKENDIIITDCDLLVVNDFSSVFDNNFEVGYTVKDFDDIFHVNGGILFLKDIEKGKIFFREWGLMVKSILLDSVRSKKIADLHGGADQGAIYEMVGGKMNPYDVRIMKDVKVMALPSSVYNLHKRWEDFSDKTTVIHFKGNWVSMLTCSNNYKQACLMNHSWRWENYELWESVFDKWQQYNSEYNAL